VGHGRRGTALASLSADPHSASSTGRHWPCVLTVLEKQHCLLALALGWTGRAVAAAGALEASTGVECFTKLGAAQLPAQAAGLNPPCRRFGSSEEERESESCTRGAGGRIVEYVELVHCRRGLKASHIIDGGRSSRLPAGSGGRRARRPLRCVAAPADSLATRHAWVSFLCNLFFSETWALAAAGCLVVCAWNCKTARGACAARSWRTARCRRRWTTRAAPAPTASPSCRAAPASPRTPSRPTAPTPSTASTSATARTRRPASSPAPPRSATATRVSPLLHPRTFSDAWLRFLTLRLTPCLFRVCRRQWLHVPCDPKVILARHCRFSRSFLGFLDR
jgi:hypothetical protein